MASVHRDEEEGRQTNKRTWDEMRKVESWDNGCRLSEMVPSQLQHAQNVEVLLHLTNQLMGLFPSPGQCSRGRQTQRCSVDLHESLSPSLQGPESEA